MEKQIDYQEISNVFFDHKLSNQELATFKDIVFSNNVISQLYFTGSIDLNSIEIIKYLIELSPFINDKYLEKFILLDEVDYDTIMNMNFENIDTWNISYMKDGNDYKLIPISKYRQMTSEREKVLKTIEDKSPLEQVAHIYETAKSLKDSDDDSLYDILINKRSNKKSKNLYIKYMLDKLGIKSFINETASNNVLVIEISDEKYKADGIYVLDVDKDSDSPIKFNHFLLTFDEYDKSLDKDKMIGYGSCLIHDYMYDREKISSIDQKTILIFETTFDSNFDELHGKAKSTKKISDEDKLSIIEEVTKSDIDSIKELYEQTKEDMFESIKINKLVS